MKQINQKLIFMRILSWTIILLIGWFFYRSLSENWHKLKDVELSITPGVIIGIVLFTLAVVVSGVLWGYLLGELASKRIRLTESIRIHSASWLLKYIPGQVGSYLNKVAWGVKQGISKKTVSTSFIYENVLMVVAGIGLSTPIVFLFKDQLDGNLSLFLPLLVVIPFAVVLSRRVFYTLLNLTTRVLKKKPFKESDFLSSSRLVAYQMGYLLPRLLNGIGFVFIVSSLLPVEPSMYIGLAATYILASIIGLLAIFVPGGLGVREAIIVLLLSVYFPIEQAIIVALVTRLYATVADIGVALIYLIFNKGRLWQ